MLVFTSTSIYSSLPDNISELVEESASAVVNITAKKEVENRSSFGYGGIPDEMLESARIDGAKPMRFFWDILVPLSRTNIAALFVILFIYGWNQYLWPLLITTDSDMTTIVVSIKSMLEAAEQQPQWNIIMMTALLAMIPPVVVVIAMQKLFVQGLTETDK